jgi:hypothetical protein
MNIKLREISGSQRQQVRSLESSGMLRCAIMLKFTDVSEMEAVCASEMSVNFNMTAQCNISEDSKQNFSWTA